MSDYIKREDTIKTIESETYRHDYLDHVIDIIEAIPSADVATVRHGRWEAIEWAVNRSGEIIIGRLYRCSECRRIVDLEHDETLNDYPYCHCGAKMDGGINGK